MRPNVGHARRPTMSVLAGQICSVVVDLPLFLTAPFYRRWHLRWGATPDEAVAVLPGDDRLSSAAYEATRAVTIQTATEAVWPWLVQVGCLRAGFYSNDLLDNLAHPSARELVPDLQQLQVGQWVPMTPRPTEETAFKVEAFVLNRWLLWTKPDSTWVWMLTALSAGETRLVTRVRARHDWTRPGIGLLSLALMELGDFAMMRRMLLGIRARAEHAASSPSTEGTMTIPDTVDAAPSSGDHAWQDAASRSSSRRAAAWAGSAGLLTLVASVAGLLVEGIYTGDRATAEMLRGYDAVNATVVVPLLAVAAWRSRTGSIRACLAASSLLAYLAYTYAVYLFGTGFNDLFLLHAAVLAAALVGIVRYLATIDVAAASDLLTDGARGRPAAAVLGLLAVALGGMWVYFGVYNAVTGEIPTGSRLVETEAMVKLGMVLDLTVLVPLYSSAAVLLWRRQTWGYVLGAIALVAGLLHQLGYVVAMPFQAVADIPGAAFSDPGEPVIVLLYALGCWLLFGARRRDAATRRGRQVTTEGNHRPITGREGSTRWS